MKKIKFLNGINAMFALAVVALATTFTSCEKEEFNVDVTPVNAQAVISPIVLAIQNGVTTDVTSQATITPSELSFTGNPTLAAKSVDVTATYEGLSATVKVNVPALQAGQFASLTPTIILQDENAETKIVAESTTEKPVEYPRVKIWDNYELFWYSLPSFTYVEKSGAKVVEGSKVINTTDLIERAAIESFFNTLENTYTEATKATKAGEYSVYANSRTTASITYIVTKTKYSVVRKAATKADAAALGEIEVDDYTTTKLFVDEDQDIPDHGHSHGHGHGHGGELNAGGGIGDLD